MVFDEKGVVLVNITGDTTPNLDDYVEVAIEAGAEDVTLEEDEDGAKVLQVSKRGGSSSSSSSLMFWGQAF